VGLEYRAPSAVQAPAPRQVLLRERSRARRHRRPPAAALLAAQPSVALREASLVPQLALQWVLLAVLRQHRRPQELQQAPLQAQQQQERYAVRTAIPMAIAVMMAAAMMVAAAAEAMVAAVMAEAVMVVTAVMAVATAVMAAKSVAWV